MTSRVGAVAALTDRRALRTPTSKSYRGWKGLDLANSRLSVPDDELHWSDNAMTVGAELQSLPIYNGALGAVLHNSTPKDSIGVYLTYGAFTSPHPVVIVVYDDGAAFQRDLAADGAVDVQIAPPGTFDPNGPTGLTIWRDGPVLMFDGRGYRKWDGVTLTMIDAAKVGNGIAVFSGHVWLATAPRTLTFTAPDTFDDFTGVNGAGAFRISDDAFEGRIQALHSSVQQLWILGVSSIDALGGVQTSAGVTTFAVTNAVTSIGTAFGYEAVIGYFRTLVFPTGTSIYGLLGVTPQPLSAKIDRLFARLTPAIAFGPKAGIVELNGRTVLAYLYNYADPNPANSRSLLICFDSGRWFVATPPRIAGHRILDMVTLVINQSPELYGIDEAGHVHRIFARATDAQDGLTAVFFKLDDFGRATANETSIRVGLDLAAPSDVNTATVQIDLVSEKTLFTLDPIAATFQPATNSPIGLRYSVVRRGTKGLSGQYLGVSVTLNSADRIAIAALHLQVDVGEEWD